MLTVPLLLAALVATPLPADTTVRISRGTTVAIEGAMSGIRLRTGDGDVVTVRGAAEVGVGSRRVTIEADFFAGRGGELTVTVPRWARVEIEGVNGNIVVEQAPEELDVESFNGQVSVTGGTGTMSLSNASGQISVRNFTGRLLDVESLSGRVSIDGATGTINVETVNERITLRNVRSRAVTLESTNGSIDWSGALDPAGRYTFTTHNGGVTLELPPTVDARLRVTTYQGGFDTAIPGTTSGNGIRSRQNGWDRAREFTVTYGRGAADVTVETFNGGVRVRRLGDT